jgi:hypothetical protein
MPAVTGAAQPGTVHKTCVHVNGCTTVVSGPPPTTSVGPGEPAPQQLPSSKFGVAVNGAPTATAGAQSQPGTLVAKLDPGRGVTCKGYTERDPTTFVFKVMVATAFRVTYVITDRITNTTADGIQFCMAANFPFMTASGAPAAPTVLPDGTSGHVGLLPRCVNATLPGGAGRSCLDRVTTVKNSSSSTGVDVILKVRVPTQTTGDPWGGS